jgi:hypothetical protein
METKIGEILEDGTIEKGQTDNGWVYKNYDAFNERIRRICYIPENGETLEDGYYYKDFLGMAEEFIERNEDVQKYCNETNTTADDIARNLFDLVDWQHPETLLDEWEINGTYTE